LARSTPAPTSRERKAARGTKRVPGGFVDEPVRARCDEPPPEALVRGIEQFNAGEFFEQHETLEVLWRETRTPVRDLYHGILQIGVGLHHWANGNFHGATVLMDEGLARIRPFVPRCQSVDVATFIADATKLRARLDTLGPERMGEVDVKIAAPRIRRTA
jgi:predicted metal-dependent hydrolase